MKLAFAHYTPNARIQHTYTGNISRFESIKWKSSCDVDGASFPFDARPIIRRLQCYILYTVHTHGGSIFNSISCPTPLCFFLKLFFYTGSLSRDFVCAKSSRYSKKFYSWNWDFAEYIWVISILGIQLFQILSEMYYIYLTFAHTDRYKRVSRITGIAAHLPRLPRIFFLRALAVVVRGASSI